jgi:hypothetical protein
MANDKNEQNKNNEDTANKIAAENDAIANSKKTIPTTPLTNETEDVTEKKENTDNPPPIKKNSANESVEGQGNTWAEIMNEMFDVKSKHIDTAMDFKNNGLMKLYNSEHNLNQAHRLVMFKWAEMQASRADKALETAKKEQDKINKNPNATDDEKKTAAEKVAAEQEKTNQAHQELEKRKRWMGMTPDERTKEREQVKAEQKTAKDAEKEAKKQAKEAEQFLNSDHVDVNVEGLEMTPLKTSSDKSETNATTNINSESTNKSNTERNQTQPMTPGSDTSQHNATTLIKAAQTDSTQIPSHNKTKEEESNLNSNPNVPTAIPIPGGSGAHG